MSHTRRPLGFTSAIIASILLAASGPAPSQVGTYYVACQASTPKNLHLNPVFATPVYHPIPFSNAFRNHILKISGLNPNVGSCAGFATHAEADSTWSR